MTASATKATIGRIVWVWLGSEDETLCDVADPVQAFAAQVILVGDDLVTVKATTHDGAEIILHEIELQDYPTTGAPGHLLNQITYATWMPYQMAQQAAAPAPTTPPTFQKV